MQIIVLGMHRSGTSALTGLLHQLGAYVGAAHELLPPAPDNPRGFFERHDALAINREILALSNCRWHQTARWRTPQLTPKLSHAMGQLVAQLSQKPVWALKDPRLCLTLPCWQPFLSMPLVVIMYRSPAAIISSLAQRNNLPSDYALALWEQHMVHALRSAALHPRVHINHAQLIHHPQLVMQTLAAATGLAPNPAACQMIDPSLVHASKDEEGLLTPHQLRICAMLKGDIAIDPALQVSSQSMQLLERLEAQVSGAPATSGQNVSRETFFE